MLKYGNKEFRNLQEQVEENMKNIQDLMQGEVVLDEFGIKVVGQVTSIDDLPTVEDYKEEHEDWAYGDAYAIGEESPYSLYILTRANSEHPDDYWFDIGVFPMPGPQGEQGIQGPVGPQGQTGPQGDSAGFGTITATAETLASGSPATATVVASGPNTAKEFAFTFGIPQNTPAGFTHYVTISASTIVGGQYTGTLTLTQYNTLYDNYDSIVVLSSTSSLANNKYFLKKWYTSDDYLVYVGVWSLNNNDTRYYLLKIDRSNRNWTLDVGQPIKITSYNINSTTATAGQILTADGSGGASWLDAGGSGLEVVTLTQSVSTLSDDDYNKLNGDNAIIKFVSSADGYTKYFKKYKDDGTYIYYYQVSQEDGSGTFFGGFRIVKSTKYCASLNSYLKVSTSNINSGSTIANQYLTSNGSGGASWTSGPSQVQSDWNESSQSSPAYIKNKPTIPTIPVTDVTVNGTSVLDGTVAKVLVDTVDGTIGGISGNDWTTLTINGSTANIPEAQVNSDWSAASGVSQILNKPTLGTAAAKDFTSSVTSGSTDLVTSGAVYTAIDNIPEPMIFKGSLGTGGTITDLPTASSANEGFVYKVITDGTYASQSAKAGDTFISDGSTWVLIPSGDEPLGTVTSVGVSVPTGLTVSNTPITSSGTIAIALDTGYVIPTQTTLNNYVTLDSAQTITNSKAFTALVDFKNTVSFYDTSGALQSNIETPYAQGSQLVGFSGMKDVGSTYKLLIPSTSAYTSDKTIATTDDISSAISGQSHEVWTFTLSDNTTVTKDVVLH